MEFVNKLPLEFKFQLIELVEQNQVPKMNKEEGMRMTEFLESWKKSANSGSSDYLAESLLYPIALNLVSETQQERTEREMCMHEFRFLFMDKD